MAAKRRTKKKPDMIVFRPMTTRKVLDKAVKLDPEGRNMSQILRTALVYWAGRQAWLK